ncbi:MAG: Bax inhibitor-1/YccA family protein [Bacteroidia bacterium]|jgi:FtsH-binding integral membrane protein|nr:Bax inhibitor-1/YccA family protein [Bacteroidia bacterium]MBP6009516.1 Bax inhibitor-1/YccA family protein [Bacteroidia bacterium]MBP7268769.1 Bax inhibitor-1/YccA family protein [Bacteroidia bacterium]MBP7436705.1 Bax inhibitor-1/YccA family protein [Bacteroidia bacterium]MBP7771601.1 Bax inhibitor-1/YccA family protein [Bacteroidia bacterium]
MENNWNSPFGQSAAPASQAVSRSFISGVFSWMGIALVISAITAYVFGTDASYMSYLINTERGGLSVLGYIVMFAPIGLVLLMGFGINRLSVPALTGVFLVYSVLMGMSLSFIFLAYTQSVIYQVFFISAAMFGVMALLGYTTKTDLTKLGSLLFMALIGIVIASLVNMFLRSPGFSYVISFIAVIVFTGLTAYDVQKLKQIGTQTEAGTEATAKLSIMGALTLYLDFINLFLALLRIFGGRRD